MKKIILLFVFAVTSVAVSKECIPAKDFVPYPKGTKNIGMYQRIHPDGDYVLHSSMYRSSSSNDPATAVQLFHLTQKDENGAARVIMTPMNDEVYPVMTDWSLFASPNHNDGMRYYSLDKILEKKQNSSATFNDKSHNQYYQSVGELEGSTSESKKIRVTLYSSRRTKDYEIEYKESQPVSMNANKEGRICDNIVSQPNKELTPEKVEKLRQELNTIALKTSELSRKYSTVNNGTERERYVAEFTALSNRSREINSFLSSSLKYEFSSPVLSHNGAEVAAQSNAPIDLNSENLFGSNYTQKIYKINPDYSCELIEDLGFQTQKIQFSPPVKGKKGKIIFVGGHNVYARGYINTVYIYDRDEKKLQKITAPNEYMQIGYPGLTKDGRAIFPACKVIPGEVICGAAIIDPNQVDPESGNVIQSSDKCISKNSKEKSSEIKQKPTFNPEGSFYEINK